MRQVFTFTTNTVWLTMYSKTVLSAFAAILAVCFFWQPAIADPRLSSQKLLSLCLVTANDAHSKKRFAECEKFIGKVRQDLRTGAIHNIRACIPNNIPDIQLVFLAIAELERAKDNTDNDAHKVMAKYYAEKWPCSS